MKKMNATSETSMTTLIHTLQIMQNGISLEPNPGKSIHIEYSGNRFGNDFDSYLPHYKVLHFQLNISKTH